MFQHPPPASVTLCWPSDNTMNATPLPAEVVARVVARLQAAGIAVEHRSVGGELVDIITGAPTGYQSFNEWFTVSGRDEHAARTIIEAALPMADFTRPGSSLPERGPR